MPRFIRAVVLLLSFSFLLPGTVFATVVEMNDGTVYSPVTIIRRDATTLECTVKYGNITLRVAEIARIDGVAIHARQGASPSPAQPGPARAATAAAMGTRSPLSSPTAPAAPLPSTPLPSPTTARAPAVPAATRPARVESVPPAWSVSLWQIVADTCGAFGILGLGWLVFRSIRRPRNAPVTSESIHEFIFLDENHQPIIDSGELGSGLENAKGVLQAAIFDRASDVHIEPGAAEYRVRFRIDGVLQPRLSFPHEQGLRMVSALKNVAQLDVSDRRKAQDGRFGGRASGRDVDFRAAATPTLLGEKLVLRILDQKSGVRGLADLGMTRTMMERFAEVIRSRSGMILATGPTGSGKTSSLYAALTQLDTVRLNIVTIEDPVEYELAGATQIPVNPKAGITFESGLRSILRQDPDVILVGEMRDLDAAQIALRSALTGHLVFSSLHSRDAIGTIHRLEEMGIERHLLASALMVVLSQRLVRVLCPECRRSGISVGNELAEIGIELPAGATIYRAGGCRKCEGTGYTGRTGLFELLILDEGLRQEINDGTPEDVLAKSARTRGYREYREDGAEKILLGVTSVEEVLNAS